MEHFTEREIILNNMRLRTRLSLGVPDVVMIRALQPRWWISIRSDSGETRLFFVGPMIAFYVGDVSSAVPPFLSHYVFVLEIILATNQFFVLVQLPFSDRIRLSKIF
ncbi:hypothetical protein BDV37DRAFT_239859 [Aspergillus pseudonomiae]|uniref:Uncharacterized protein n=1 Tax=Aspergillus pseudonomiae TaxID=1506151 RepID=A0A5N7DPW5_9EURO|nr:uncharacterized protein BDV37DRAFT_239859 [Aspergillus pseudonomiae]KAE8408069.1 hypothetical protein BDV37DRAFT_239859 [Aspergillus pseudonomiae]